MSPFVAKYLSHFPRREFLGRPMFARAFGVLAIAALGPAAADQTSDAARRVALGLPSADSLFVNVDAPKVDLGRRLFMDKRLSSSGSVSCSTCHDPALAFSDGRDRAVGVNALRGTRNAPSLFNVAFSTSLFWDGRQDTLEGQARAPFTNSIEHGLKSEADLVAAISRDARYSKDFAELFPKESRAISLPTVASAIAAFERTLISGNSSFDRYYFGNDKTALDQSARRGLELFRGRARCASCHLISEEHALFTDGTFHPTVTRLSPETTKQLSLLTEKVVRMRSGDRALESLDALISQDPQIASLGRFVVTLKPADIGMFKTPSLRNVALTAPYMHDGSVPTLERVVDIELYVRGTGLDHPIPLGVDERADLIAFLRSLTGDGGKQR